MGIRLIVRVIVVPVMIFGVGVSSLLVWQILEGFAESTVIPTSLGWGDPVGIGLQFAAYTIAGTLLAIAAWGIFAPIANDTRQELR